MRDELLRLLGFRRPGSVAFTTTTTPQAPSPSPPPPPPHYKWRPVGMQCLQWTLENPSILPAIPSTPGLIRLQKLLSTKQPHKGRVTISPEEWDSYFIRGVTRDLKIPHGGFWWKPANNMIPYHPPDLQTVYHWENPDNTWDELDFHCRNEECPICFEKASNIPYALDSPVPMSLTELVVLQTMFPNINRSAELKRSNYVTFMINKGVSMSPNIPIINIPLNREIGDIVTLSEDRVSDHQKVIVKGPNNQPFRAKRQRIIKEADTTKWCRVEPCGHGFHENCIKQWTNQGINKTCPMCRSDIQTIVVDIYNIKIRDCLRDTQIPQVSRTIQVV